MIQLLEVTYQMCLTPEVVEQIEQALQMCLI